MCSVATMKVSNIRTTIFGANTMLELTPTTFETVHDGFATHGDNQKPRQMHNWFSWSTSDL